jgi:hypothetical protein
LFFFFFTFPHASACKKKKKKKMDEENELLDLQVEKPRHLNDPLRVAQVSGSTFPLRVWERMFALDREQRAVDAVKRRQNDDDYQNQQLEQTNRSSGGADHNNNINADGGESQFSGGSRRSSPSMGSMSSFGDHLGFGGLSRRKPPQLRNCRDGARLNSNFMRSLVRESFHHPENHVSSNETTQTINTNNQRTEVQENSSSSKGKNLFGLFSSLSVSEETVQKNQTAPIAILSCVSVPERLTTPQKNASKDDLNNKNSPSPQRDSKALVSVASPSTTSRKDDHKSVGSFRSHPIRPFAPISSFWGNNVTNGGAVDGGGFADGGISNAAGGGAAGNGTVIGAELLRQQIRLQAMARPAVERHDLPFEITPANDFRQLPCPLTGLGHAIPYEDLQQEQKLLMSLCSKR